METFIKHSGLTLGRSSNTATFEHNQTLNDNLEPISSAYVDLQGNLIQLWRWKVDTVIASIRDSQQKLSFVTGDHIHNALLPHETGKQLLDRLVTVGYKHWHLAYEAGHLHVWPFLTAEARKTAAGKLDESHPGWQVALNYKRADNLAGRLCDLPHTDISIDTSKFTSGKKTKYGGIRSNDLFWQAWATDPIKSKALSSENLERILFQKPLKSPVIDETWLQYFPEHKLFLGDILIHHHVNHGPLAIPVPESTHSGQEKFWHMPARIRAFMAQPGASVFIDQILQTFKIQAKNNKVLEETLQINRLIASYNISNLTKPMAAARSGAKPTGGVEQKVGIIQGLLDNYNGTKEYEHAFYIPSKNGTQPFTDTELRQILQELASGIYYHDTVPFFSLHFNTDSNMYPVIHPAYKNTLIGKIISMLDYYMKGFLNGAFFDEGFVHEWQVSRTQDKALLKEHLIDVHEYCLEHLGADTQYFSIRELIDHFEILEAVKEASQEDTDTSEATLLSDYSGFRSSFRIIAHQNKIQKSEHLFMLDGDFGVAYTIEPDTAYAEELTKYRNRFGHDPKGYRVLEKAYQAMARQIRSLMPKLPKFQELFEMLKVINFFCYYYKTLKQANRIPLLTPVQPVKASCPSLFPHLPIRKMVKQDVEIDLYAA